MEYKIIRGAKQIGGTITEISSRNTRIWVDFGSDLSIETGEESDKRVIEQMQESPPDAVVFTHVHGDHIGLLYALRQNVKKIFIGAVARQMLVNIRKTLLNIEENKKFRDELDMLNDKNITVEVEDKKPFYIGDIKVTPLRCDHSVYDSFMYKFEADGESIVHTGDFRMHGRLGAGLIKDIETTFGLKTDILIIEGTMMSRATEKAITEIQMEKAATKLFTKNKYAFLICSSINMESLASFYHAMIKSGDQTRKPAMIVNRYVKAQLELFTCEVGKKRDKRFCFNRVYCIEDGLNKVLPNGKTQKQQMLDEGFVMLVGTNEYYQQLMEQFREFSPILVYSMWDGYLDERKSYARHDLINVVNKWKNSVVHLHTSGHASTKDIAEVIKKLNPCQAIVPVHTENAEGFQNLDIPERLRLCCKTGRRANLYTSQR